MRSVCILIIVGSEINNTSKKGAVSNEQLGQFDKGSCSTSTMNRFIMAEVFIE